MLVVGLYLWYRKHINNLNMKKVTIRLLGIGWVLDIGLHSRSIGTPERLVKYCNDNDLKVTNKDALTPKFSSQLIH